MRRNSGVPAAAILLVLVLLPRGIGAQENAAAKEKLTYSGDSLVTVLSESGKRLLLTGNARIQTADVVIRADRIEVYGPDLRYAQCSGNVRVVDTKRGIDLTSRELFYDRQEKLSRVTGNAVMADLKNELVVKGGFIEDREAEKLTVVQIGVRILKKDMVCRAEFARYYREKEILELSGMPWVSRKGDEYRAGRITVNLDTEEITLEADVKGEIKTGNTEDSKGSAPAGQDAEAGAQSGTQPAQGDADGE